MLSNKAIFLFILVVLVVMWFGGAVLNRGTANIPNEAQHKANTAITRDDFSENNTSGIKPISENDKCVPAGCSKQLCVSKNIAKDIISTCEYKEVYSCYRKATCERQTSGECGWTETAELIECVGQF